MATIPAALLLTFHAGRYYPFIADDGLISLRYAQRFAQGKGLSWTDGERVEGYSNLTWVLGTALLDFLGMDGVVAARVLGAIGMLGALWGVAAWEHRSGDRGLLSGAISASALALTGAMGVWSIGGLEQPLVALFLVGAICACRELLESASGRMLRLAAASLALLCLSRPDGPLLACSVVAAFALARGVSMETLRNAVRLGLPSAAAILSQLAFRLLYYGDWVPNTARAKLALTKERVEAGWIYLEQGFEWLWPLFAVALVATLLGRAWKRAMLLVWIPLVTWTGYVVFIGGDIFPGRRHLVPLVVLLGLIIASGLVGILERARLAALGSVLCALTLAYQVKLTLMDPDNHRAIEERFEWHGQVIGKLLRHAFAQEQPLLAVDAAGCLPYFSRLPSLDMLGLNDRFLARHPPPDLGKGFVGHELGNGPYVFEQKPDLVSMCPPDHPTPGPCFRSGIELLGMPEFRRDYLVVRFEGRTPHPAGHFMWVRKEGRVGMRDEGAAVRVPGFLLASAGGVAALDAAGRLGAELPAGSDVALELPSDCPECRVEVDADEGASAQMVGQRQLRVRTERPTHVRAVIVRKPH